MTSEWKDHAKRLGDAVTDGSKKAKERFDEAAPEVSRKVRQQIQETSPVIAHRVREAGKALTAPASPPSSTAKSNPPVVDSNSDYPHPQPWPSDNAEPANLVAWAQSGTNDVRNVASDGAVAWPYRPVAVHIACLALIVAAAGSAILAALGVYGLTEFRGSVDKVLHLDPTGTAASYSNDYVDNAETMLMSSAIGLGIIFALAYSLVALAVRKGHGWPRPVGTVLAVLSLPVIFLGPIAVLIVVAGVIAVLALWTRGARQYAVQIRAAKSMVRAR